MISPSEAELSLLKLFWAHGPMSAREVQVHAGPELDWATSTTRTTLERMKAKGLLERRSVHGMAVYQPAQSKVSVVGALLSRMRGLLDIRGPLPVSAFAGSELLTPDELDELEAWLAAEERGAAGSEG